MSQTIVTLSADDKQLLAALKRISGAQDNVDAGFKKVKKSSKDSTSDFEKGINNVVAGVAGWATGMVAVDAAVQMVNGSYQDILDKQARSLEIARDLAEVQAAASKNMGGMSPQETAAVFDKVNRISADTGFGDVGKLNEAVASGLGVTSDIDAVTNTVKAAAPLAILSPDELKELTRGALSVQRATGVTDPKAALGFLQSAAGNAFIESNAMVASRMTPVLGSALREVPTQDPKAAAIEVSAIFGEMSKLLSDSTGDISKTNTDKFFRELDKVFDTRPEMDPKTLGGRIAAVQASPELRAELLKGFGENEGTGAIKQLLDQSSAAAKSFQNSLSTIKFDPAVYSAEVKDQASLTPQIAVETSMRKSEARSQTYAQNDDLTTIAAVDKIVTQTLDQTRLSGFLGMLDREVAGIFGSGLVPAPGNGKWWGDKAAAAYNVTASIPGFFGFNTVDTGDEAITAGIERLKGQKTDIQELSSFSGDLGDRDKKSLMELDKAIQLLEEMRANREQAIANRASAQMNEQTSILRDIKENLARPPADRPATPIPTPAQIRQQATAGASQ